MFRLASIFLVVFSGVAAGPVSAQLSRATIYAEAGHEASGLMARDLAGVVAPSAGMRLTVVESPGSVAALQRMRDNNGLRFGIVTEDIAPVYNAAASKGFGEAAALVGPVRAVATLHRLDFHFIVRADSPFTDFPSIRGARINLGQPGGTTALSVMNLYREVFGEPIPDPNASFLTHEEGLVKLVTDRTVDVVAIVADQPAKILADMRSDARKFVRLLPTKTPSGSRGGLATERSAYSPSRLLARYYGSLIDDDVDAVAVRTVLVYHEDKRGEHELAIASFARALCERYPRLLDSGNRKWREVTLVPPDPALGWHYASPLTRGELRRCSTGLPVSVPVPACTSTERNLRICD